MTAAAFLAEIALDAPKLDLWLEVEGLPYAVGLTARDSSWFAARNYEHRRLSTLGLLVGPPDGIEQEVRPFDADSSVGQMTAKLIDDASGTVRAWYAGVGRSDGWLRLSANVGVPAAPSSSPANVDLTYSLYPGASAPDVGSYVYLGRETMEVVSYPVGGTMRVKRALFQPPTALERRAYQHTAGDIISPYPRFLATRRAYLYSAPRNGTDADKVLRWAGTIRGAKLPRGLSVLEVTMESLVADLNARAFTGQIRGKLATGIKDGTGLYDAAEEESAPLVNRLRLEAGSVSGRAWTDGARVVVRVGDEIMSGRLRTTYANEIHLDDTSASTNDGRGLFGTVAEQHSPGDEVIEVLPIIGYRANGRVEERVSKFTQGDNPIEVALQILLSRDGDGTNGTYDVLPTGWGASVDQARVGAANALALRDRWLPVAREIRLIEEPFVVKELLASILKTHLCYPVVTLDDILELRFLGPPMPDEVPRAISGTHVVGLPSWASGIESVVGRLIVRCDYDPIEAAFRQTYKGEFLGPGNEAQEFYAGLFTTLEVEAPGQWSGNDPGSARWGARLTTDAESTAIRYFDLVRDRLARPFPAFDVECQYDAMDVEVGDLLAVTVAGVPDVLTGAAALSGAVCEVRRKVVDDRRGLVTFSLVQTAYRNRNRLLGPCAIIASGATASQATCEAHVFSDPAGSVTDALQFGGGHEIIIMSPDLTTQRGRRNVLTLTPPNTIVWAGDVTFQAGDVIMLADYTYQSAFMRGRYAFLASADVIPLLGTNPAHEFAP